MAGVANRRGGPLARICGARAKAGGVCQHPPLRESLAGRCLRHAGPVAARAYQDRLARGLETGSVAPEVFARATARRDRNRLTHGWKRNPSLPGRTIDLGASEARFAAALDAAGVDVAALMPAVRDWLAWRFQRLQVDRDDRSAWTRVVRDALPRRIAAAEAAMVWVRAGILDRRTKAGRAFKAALGKAGMDAVPPEVPKAMPILSVRPWVAPGAGHAPKRALPDRIKAPARAKAPSLRGPGRPRKAGLGEGELAALMVLLREAGPQVRDLFDACPGDGERMQMLRCLQALHRAPDDPQALQRWMEWVRPRR